MSAKGASTPSTVSADALAFICAGNEDLPLTLFWGGPSFPSSMAAASSLSSASMPAAGPGIDIEQGYKSSKEHEGGAGEGGIRTKDTVI